ncbi:intradiol ring-cleavage dioxygenase [Pseudokineococcus sp. 1T1Z-3]|uniref:intradiol ring-cleavage dioxygenase n=1 Tax=Pseudokineococcus sp. 1T1Z-3 TaxID=3132745 RepID=UPI0030A7C823
MSGTQGHRDGRPSRDGRPTPPATYEGRVLPRPREDVEDQGLAFDVATMVRRRQVLRGLGLGAVGMALAACGATTSASSSTSSAATPATDEIPDETAGPYPGDGSNGPDVLESSGVVRSDITSSFGSASGTAEGVPMELTLTVTDIAGGGVPFAGAAVYVWHCDAQGRYSLYSDGVTQENYLRGVQVAGDDGVVRFTSVVPACYSGRWPHVHLEVYPDVGSITDVENAVATSQVALPQDLCDAVYAVAGYEGSAANLARTTLASDTVFGDDGGASQLATVSGDVASGYAVSLAVGVDTSTEPTGGGLPGGSDGAGGGRGGPPPGGRP